MSSVSFLRKETKDAYVQYEKTISYDRKLSWKAKGLLTIFLGLKNGQDFKLSQIYDYSTDGESSTDSGIDELKKQGYFELQRWRGKKGHFEWGFVIHETPLTVPVLKWRVIDNPNRVGDSETDLQKIADKLDVDIETVKRILEEKNKSSINDYKNDFLAGVKVVDLILNQDNLKPFALDKVKIQSLKAVFIEQKTVFSAKYKSLEEVNKHFFNWIPKYLSKTEKPVKPMRKTDNLPPQYEKENVVKKVVLYKKQMEGVTENHTLTYYKESVKNLLHWLGICEKNGWLSDRQLIEYDTLKEKSDKGLLKPDFTRQQAKNRQDTELKPTKYEAAKEVTDKLSNLAQQRQA
jgi:hypothetical protein